jgi:hypothetical protein
MNMYETEQWNRGMGAFFAERDLHYDTVEDYPIILRRNWCKVWTGYVGIPSTHPHYEDHYDVPAVEVHGGLTYGENKLHALFIPIPEGFWWFGFDCNHHNDLSPLDIFRSLTSDNLWTLDKSSTYRTFEYALEQATSLAKQLKELA